MVTERLVEFACGPVEGEAALAMMRLSLMDWAACGIAGAGEPVARIVREMALEEGGAAQAALFGGGRAPARAAGLVNGTISHALDYDDTHFGHIGHPSVAVIPAALAIGERGGASGRAILEAALVGAEVSIRVGMWLGRDHYQTGFHQTATAGAFGATAAAGRLLRLSPGQMAQALGLVATRASGLKSQFGTMGKPYNAGLAAASGVEVALLAARGFVSNPQALDGPQGFGPTHTGQGDLSAFDGLGSVWRMEAVSHKFHACCHGLHAMLEALAEIAPHVSAVDAVEVTTHPRWLSVCNIAAPRTGLEAKFSYRLTAAMALSGLSTAALGSFSERTARDPALAGLSDKVRVDTDAALPETAARVRVHAEGGWHAAEHDLAAPMTLQDRAAKLRRKSAALLGEARADALWQATQSDDLSALLAQIVSPQAPG
ncbi:MmgE/PrpD family protein [Candidatus Rhodobacter oscarellae]|uniref:MmgE/PrpD family protein n=1 Tax=Candidatus Rhodobacter oscarellae TaxID=1675527 RepID=A0A0J9GUW1_9RHOB|nr:MmgE/PrpD family protein [Candidatus Rhodobacter lobularis]KMW57368.1 MmgE/PrpD family protein [Candidatus Rhodobacter lobularis]